MGNKAAFIDRDGTINANIGYIDNPDSFKMHSGVAEGIKLLNKDGFKVIIITNQSGIARGFFSEETLDKIHDKMKTELSDKGAKIDAIYYCPHHPDDKCDCRKPEAGLLEKAIRDFDIDIDESFIIGDRMLDVEAGHKVGIKTVLVPENKEKVAIEMKNSRVDPDFICDDFITGAEWVAKPSNRDV